MMLNCRKKTTESETFHRANEKDCLMQAYFTVASRILYFNNHPPLVLFRITKREDCEMIMLIGMPGCGKTTWVNKYLETHSDKKFDVIGTATLIDKMKVIIPN